MKLLRKLTVISSAVMTLIACGLGWGLVHGETFGGKLTYMVRNGKAVITGFEGQPEVLDIPSMIEGKPVCEIRENAFYRCSTLKKVVIPESVEKIGDYAFSGCTSLKQLYIHGSVSVLPEGCFSGCDTLESVVIPSGVRVVGKNCFYRCGSLNSITLPDSLTDIGCGCFAGCEALKDVELCDGLLRVEDKAFFDCRNLSKVNVPDSVIELGALSFGYLDGDIYKSSALTLTGSSKSLGKVYALENAFTYESTDSVKSTAAGGNPVFPVVIVITSGAGLLFFCILDKLRQFRSRYEYEC